MRAEDKEIYDWYPEEGEPVRGMPGVDGAGVQDREKRQGKRKWKKRPPKIKGSSREDYIWVYHHLGYEDITEKDAPSAGAWGLLLYARDNKKTFYEMVKPLSVGEDGEDPGHAATLHGSVQREELEKLFSRALGEKHVPSHFSRAYYDGAYHETVRSWQRDEDVYPFYDLVPKSPEENLRLRMELLKLSENSRQVQEILWNACRKDTLFFLNLYCFLYEPRPRPKLLPFITLPHQDYCLSRMEACLGHRDLGIEKSRGEGASWMLMMMFLRFWIFGDRKDERPERYAFGVVSRTEEAVDDPDDPDSLFWKLDFQLDHLPPWMVPEFDRRISKHTLRNEENGSTIIGYAAVGDVASGGRKTCIGMDEMAKFPKNQDYAAMTSTQYVTDSRFVISTFKGNSGYYYEAMRGAVTSLERVVLDWKDNPLRNSGLYRLQKGGHIRALDSKNDPLPSNYAREVRQIYNRLRQRGFILEGKIRSPWYDKECDRTGATPDSIAEEVDRDPERSGSPFFEPSLIDRLMTYTRPPELQGSLDYDLLCYEPHGFVQQMNGPWKLWLNLNLKGTPEMDIDYVMGIDISAGGGGSLSSNSVITIATMRGEKVAEFASNSVMPQQLARIAFAAGHWFRGPMGVAYLIYESNGTTGSQFRSEIEELSYPRLFLDTRETIGKKKIMKSGFHNQGDRRGDLYGKYRMALSDGHFSNPCREALEECRQYHNQPGGGIEHASAAGKRMNPNVQGHNHGDRCTADALCYRGMCDYKKRYDWTQDNSHDADATINTKNAPEGSYLARRNQWRSSRETAATVW